MQTLHLLQFNNYYNRQLRFFKTIAEYSDYTLDLVSNVNFNPNDGVLTEQILNWQYNTNPDYLLVEYENGTFTRWFVIESKRTRNGQYKLTLKRDTMADFYEEIKNAPAMVEKGYLNDNDPFIFNSEGQAYNQIKTDEFPLTDETRIPWIVAFISKNAFEEGKTVNITYPSDEADITETSLDDWKFLKYTVNPGKSSVSYQGALLLTDANSSLKRQYTVPIDYNNYYKGFEKGIADIGNPENTDFQAFGYRNKKSNKLILNEGTYPLITSIEKKIKTFYSGKTVDIYNNILNLDINNGNILSSSDLNEILNLKGKTIYFSDTEQSFKINVITSELKYLETKLKDYEGYNYKKNVLDILNNNMEYNTPFRGHDGPLYAKNYYEFEGNINEENFYIYTEYKDVYITLTPTFNELIFQIPSPSNRYHLEDAPYDMFCIPYNIPYKNEETGEYELFTLKDGSKKITPRKDASLFAAFGLTENLTAGAIYDVQILPYCPMRRYIQSDNTFDCSNGITTNIYQGNTITENATIVSKILWCNTSSFNFNINNKPIKIENLKESNELDLYRLCSPNYNGAFDLNAAKNRGVDEWEISATYKPYNPYIHVNPKFKALYGSDFNDRRGLILGGDFSVPQLTNAWAEYQLQNKNFQASFDREIQSLELQNKIGLAQDITGAISGTVSSTAAGFITGGPAGAVAGGIAGGLGGAADIATNQMLRNDNLDKTKTLFKYNLENIQAIPSSLSKSSAFDIDNKYFPFVEYYTCSPEERNAFRDKIKYNGMTIMRMGTIEEFLNPGADETYVQGQFVRLSGINDEFHTAQDIAREFSQGIYVGKGV